MRSLKRLLVTLAAVAAIAIAGSAPALACPPVKVVICHAKPADTAANGWNLIEVPKSAIAKSQGHGTHAADIIPPFEAGSQWDAFAGLNWTEVGQSIWNNGCKAPEVSPSPSPTPSPTPTPTPEPTPTPTTEPTPTPTPSPTPSPTLTPSPEPTPTPTAPVPTPSPVPSVEPSLTPSPLPTPPPTDTEPITCVRFGHEADCTGDAPWNPTVIMVAIGVYILMHVLYVRSSRR